MKKTLKIFGVFILLLAVSCSKKEAFPVTVWNSNSEKPVIFYISGDGGFNNFSKSFAENLHRYGYDVFALNSKKYFWDKKTPLQTSQDTENYLKNIISKRKNKQIILIGYSYGADVSPFVYNRFDAEFKKNIKKLVIIGPSKVNDFEVRLSEYISDKEYGFSVVHEINSLKDAPLLLVVSDFEYYHFPLSELALKDYQFLHLKGNHHFSGDTRMLAERLVPYF